MAEKALLSLRVCDPAVGSGHFLVAAAHRIARRLAAVRSGEEEPAPGEVRHALRQVVGHCLYGVDVNPMAVELCKVSLWLEAMEPGKPLTFLDHHIRTGNSLLGTSPELIAQGIPDGAFKTIEGDDKKLCSALRKRNRQEREGQKDLLHRMVAEPEAEYHTVAALSRRIDQAPDETLADVQHKAESFHRLVVSPEYQHAQKVADAWCAAFVWSKQADAPAEPITTDDLRRLEGNPEALSPAQRPEVERLAGQYRFFHWHLAFPEVFGTAKQPISEAGKQPNSQQGEAAPVGCLAVGYLANPGFDCVLGNPPWERVKLQEKEWFAERSPEIANAPNAAARKRMIEALKANDPGLYQQFLDDSRRAEGESHLMRNSGRYPLCGRGDINLYTVFAEGMRSLVNEHGRAGCVLPTGIATDDTTKFFFQDVVEKKSLVSLVDFENKGIFFPGVHSSYKFCLFTAGRGHRPTAESAEFVFFAHGTDDLRDPERRFTLSAEDIALLNPNTRTCPIFRSRKDAELTKAIYRRVPVLVREAGNSEAGNREAANKEAGNREAANRDAGNRDPDSLLAVGYLAVRSSAVGSSNNPWGIKFSTMFHMSNDSHLFRTREQLQADGWTLDGNVFRKGGCAYLPLYEAKMVDFYDHRAAHVVLSASAMVRQGQPDPLTIAEHQNASGLPMPRCWVSERAVNDKLGSAWARRWFLGIRDITSSTNERTVIPAVLPFSGVGNNLPILLLDDIAVDDGGILCACLSSFPLDFTARFKVAGLHLNFFIVEQFPVVAPRIYMDACRWDCRVLVLRNWLLPRIIELTYTAWDLEPFAEDCGWFGPPFRWDEERRFLLRCELDAAFFHLYLGSPEEWRMSGSREPGNSQGGKQPGSEEGNRPAGYVAVSLLPLLAAFPTPRDAVSYIMDTFPIVRRKDEAQYGRYRTKDTILEIYDAMQEAIRTGMPYQTRLDPPPGPPVDAEGRFVSMYRLDRDRWPAHIHPLHPDWDEALLEAWFRLCGRQWDHVAEEQVFPWDGRESFVYAFIPYLGQERPGERFEFYRDAALLASRPQRCETLLMEDALRDEYKKVMRTADWLQFPDSQRLRAGKVREKLQANGIIETDPATGKTTLKTPASLPPLPPELRSLLPLILNAADNLDKLQRDALERAEAEKLGMRKDAFAKESEAFMVA